MKEHYIDTPTKFVEVDGAAVAYRSIGTVEGTPIVYLNHLAANLDNCDPQLMDALAADFKVISFDYPGMGLSAGKCATSVEEMAREAIAFIRALGYTKVHLLGLSLGGFVAQSLLAQSPELVDRVILAGTGPAGDKGIARVPRITYYDMLCGLCTGRDPRYYLFFPSTSEAKHRAKAFILRTALRRDRDKSTTLSALRRQLKAVVAWAKSVPQDLSGVQHRIWVVNGDNDRMVPTAGSYDMVHRLPNATLTIIEGAGHGAIFQELELFSIQATAFYKASEKNVNTNETK